MKRTMRNLLGGASLAALCVIGTSAAMASPIDLGGYSGPIQIKFNDFESFTGTGGLAVSNSNYGILQITSILDKNGNQIYSAPTVSQVSATNPLILGVFSGIHVGSVNPILSSAEANTPGAFSFYDVTQAGTGFGTIAAQGSAGYTGIGCSVNSQCYNGITNMGYDNILNFSLVQGASSTDPLSFLHAEITTFSPLVGEASGFGDITGGSDAAQFIKGGQTTALGTPADLFIQDNFCASGTKNCSAIPSTDWTLASNDPVTTAVIPEPGTLTLFGAGLLALGVFGARRRKRAA